MLMDRTSGRPPLANSRRKPQGTIDAKMLLRDYELNPVRCLQDHTQPTCSPGRLSLSLHTRLRVQYTAAVLVASTANGRVLKVCGCQNVYVDGFGGNVRILVSFSTPKNVGSTRGCIGGMGGSGELGVGT